MKMEIKKTVHDGNINLEIINPPVYPAETRLHGNSFVVYTITGLWLENAKKATIGDFSFVFPNQIKKDMDAETIARYLIENHEGFMTSYNNFLHSHTETIEILTPEATIVRLSEQKRLCYRNKQGRVQTLDI